MLEKLVERHKNPLSWVARVIFFITLCLGFWLHNFWIIIISAICLATSWFWFPRPKEVSEWSTQLVEAELAFLRRLCKGCEAMALTFWIVLGVITLFAFWQHSLLLGLWVIEIMLLFKLIWSLFMIKQAKWCIMMILAALMIVDGVLLFILR